MSNEHQDVSTLVEEELIPTLKMNQVLSSLKEASAYLVEAIQYIDELNEADWEDEDDFPVYVSPRERNFFLDGARQQLLSVYHYRKRVAAMFGKSFIVDDDEIRALARYFRED